MEKKKNAKKFGIIFVVVMILAGLLLMYTGNDALVLATQKKEGILTAEQVKVSFESVSGRLIKENVKEAQMVKKGDVLIFQFFISAPVPPGSGRCRRFRCKL